MKAAIRVKPHHFIDIVTALSAERPVFEPHPYGHAVHSVARAVLADRDSTLEMELGADDICAPCIHNAGGRCDDTIDTSFRPAAPTSKGDYNLLIDRRWCRRLELRQGDRLTAREFVERLRGRSAELAEIYRENPPERVAKRAADLAAGIRKFLERRAAMGFETSFRFLDYVDSSGSRRPDPEPARIYGPVHSIGPLTVCAYLVETNGGLVVIDTSLPKDGELVASNITKLGFDPRDIRLIFNTHWHWDHAGGNAHLVGLSDAELAVHELDAEIVETGLYRGERKMPGCRVDRRLTGGETIEHGGLAFRVFHTPGQSAGSIAILATVDGPQGPCRALFAGDSTGFKDGVEELELLGYPGVCADYRRTVEVFMSLEIDIYLGGHPHQVFREMRADGNPFVTREEYLKLVNGRHAQMERFVAEHPKYLEW